MTTTDVLVAIPVIPAVPLLLTWFLPWERWVWSRLPGKFLGPYLFYCTFAAWYFKLPWWSVMIVGAWGVGISLFVLINPKPNAKSRSATGGQ